ncbi:hypothetical protein LJC31_04580 [Synergistaceae bacterium OttesenSCG-928-I11]|nr:hypothetical protein [Synergistaceae bacterium OttesenSCG-928-I11]
MAFTRIVISPALSERFPDARVGWLLADARVRASDPYVEELKKNLAANLASRGITEENLAKQPDIAAWRDVYSAMGAKPSKYRSSLEALARRVAKGQGLWNVSNVVDCYNCASVATFLPMGAHDTSRVDGVLTLRYGHAGEKFYPLGADEQHEVIDVDPRNVVYADDSKICCWLWNHRDTHLASVQEETKEAIFLIDSAFVPHTTSIEGGLEILAGHLEKIGCKPKDRGIVRPGDTA